ncbi:glycerol-3-phosphate dehydrogenase/oxidase [Chitinophaga silvatica]|uniref:Glycerol-3-phosphate dehydrogenase/oxidase n=1 Tax=Chitinophaga silvatica TaxID=2282649 RepID=A0A3E1Y8D5_9BACT|nr:glycerol-3-phosphate dehydrogenase/oxidase [Chitinophaga silvatica]RFS21440.1 glycerol-3-phosphate dehydrogenase/oxidase [Chitinophaga silvatica]
MNREMLVASLRRDLQPWDVIVIGGGATGLGAALESVTRGYRTLLLEQVDFAKSTSSKSTKLVHGGVRYLAQGDVSLVREASVERGLLSANAPHLVRNLAFVIPTFSWWDNLKYTIGLKLYDWLAGRLSLGKSVHISKAEAIRRLSTLQENKLSGGVLYHDGQFDDSRLAINLAQTISDKGGTALNYMRVVKLSKDEEGNVNGVTVRDTLNGREDDIHLNTRAIINATGVFADDILEMDNPAAPKSIAASQGVHLVVDREFLPGTDALMIPQTSDGRVLFMVPWHDKVVVGTTDTPVNHISLEPHPMEKEIRFILDTAAQYLAKPPKREDVRSLWAGLRPLAAAKAEGHKTKEISRSHKIIVSSSNLITIIGGKWTTYRRMAADVIHKMEEVLRWKETASVTEHMRIHGAMDANWQDPWYFYGTDEAHIRNLIAKNPEMNDELSKKYNIVKAQVVWAVREEMARNIEDFLARRVRLLFLDAKEALRIAPAVARIMAEELHKDEHWVATQISSFADEAKAYLLDEDKSDAVKYTTSE